VALFRDKPEGFCCEVQGRVCSFDLVFDVWKFGASGNVVDKEFSPVPINARIRGLESVDFSGEHRQVRLVCSCWGCGVGYKH
jgi:hypothetical protein